MDDYRELNTTPTEDNIVHDLQYRVTNLSTSETRNYFQNLFMPNDQNRGASKAESNHVTSKNVVFTK